MAISDIDNRFGSTAVKLGYITSEQLIEAMTIQVQENVNDGLHRLIGSILLEQGNINIEQIDTVLKAML